MVEETVPTACPICAGPTRPESVPVRVERRGRELMRLAVPARACDECGHLDVAEGVTEDLVAVLEARTLPGDDIIISDVPPGQG